MLGLMNEAQKYNEGDEYWYRTGADGCYDISVLDTGEAGSEAGGCKSVDVMS